MKLNNKGVTIIELLVSVALVSVVLMFLYNLLSNVTFEKTTDFIASTNQANRIDIITTIENDLILDNDVELVESQTTARKVVMKGKNGQYQIVITDDTLKYSVKGVLQNTWKIKGGKFGDIECISEGDKTKVIQITQCTIPVYTTNVNNKKDNNNTLDDIIFSFIK